jgi:serine/threonine protein kinase/tetratricopeptide (TPR) repeat protein
MPQPSLRPEPAGDCLLDSELLQVMEGEVSHGLQVRLDLHIDGCERCFRLLAGILRSRSIAGARLPVSTTQLDVGGAPLGPTPPALGRRYAVLEQIGAGGMGRVYRTLDRLTGQQVAVKQVLRLQTGSTDLSATTQSPPGEALAYARCLEQEFRVLAALRHPHIISVLDYGFDTAGQPFISMELLHEARPILPFARSLSRPQRITLLLQMLQAIAYLHRRGILHRDIKPGNVLVVPQGPDEFAVKVVDFGLSASLSSKEPTPLAGTLAYMAPELLRGGAPSVASDLYALGLVSLELLLGAAALPYDAQTTQLLSQLLAGRHQSLLSRLDPHDPLSQAVAWALQDAATDRPADVDSFCHEICRALAIPPPPESRLVRESVLSAASFVGRQPERNTLIQALLAAHRGQGSGWLLSGASGVGKSRLLEELRSQALLSGVTVLRGQAVSDGGTPYQLWQDVIALLALYVELSDHEAALLTPLLPRLSELLGRPLPELPLWLDAQAVRLAQMRALREIVLRRGRPLVILLEDLHWADAESLSLLAQIAPLLSQQPLLIVGSYRDDESTGLADALPAMQRLPLLGLAASELHELCLSILAPAHCPPALLQRIERATGGNTFFIVEVLRTLAEEAGSLAEIGGAGGPLDWFSGDLAQVLSRRLQRVPAAARDLLALSAVMGRYLDLTALAGEYSDVNAAVGAAVDAGVLEVHEGRVRFRHDKLREQRLSELDPHSQRVLHARAAAAIERSYPTQALPAARLARHHHQAQQLEPAMHFYAQAGGQALAVGAAAEAVAALEQAVALPTAARLSRLQRVRIWRQLTQARYALGQLRSTDAALRQVTSLAGWPMPRNGLEFGRKLGQEVQGIAKQLLEPQRGRQDARMTEEERALAQEFLLALTVEEVYVWLSKPGLTLVCCLHGLQLARTVGAAAERQYFEAAVAFLLSFTPLGSIGFRLLQSTVAQGSGLGEIDALRTQAIVALHQGQRDIAVASAERAVERSRQQRDDFALLYSLLQQQLTLSEVEAFTRLQQVACEMEQLAALTQNGRYVALALIGQLGAELNFGNLDNSEALYQRALGPADLELGAVPEAVLHGLGAMTALRRGLRAEARVRADRTRAAQQRARWPLLQLRFAYIGMLDVYLDDAVTERAVPPAQIAGALGALGRDALLLPGLRPLYALVRGRLALQRGQGALARGLLELALRLSRRSGTQFEQGWVHYYLGMCAAKQGGAHSPIAQELAIEELTTAARLFAQIGAAWDLAETERRLRELRGG